MKSFIDSLTARKVYSNECINFKYNAYENLLKARNSKFVSEIGLKEHMVTYLSSGKARHTTQVFSKQGGKGSRPVLGKILKNSEYVYKFEAPDNVILFLHLIIFRNFWKATELEANNKNNV